jgi:hypothetical protein
MMSLGLAICVTPASRKKLDIGSVKAAGSSGEIRKGDLPRLRETEKK